MTRNIIYFLKNRGVLFHKNSPEFLIETFIKTGVQKKLLLLLPTRILIQKAMLSLLRYEVEAILDNYTIELRDSSHGVFQCVLLSPVTLNRIL